MAAFNARFKSTTLGGVPTLPALSLVVAVLAGILLLVTDGLIFVALLITSVGAFLVFLVSMVFGDELRFLRTMLVAKRLEGKVTGELWRS